MCQYTDWFIQHKTAMGEDLLEFGSSLAGAMAGKVCLSADVGGIQIRPIIIAVNRQPKLTRLCRCEQIDCLLRFRLQNSDFGL